MTSWALSTKTKLEQFMMSYVLTSEAVITLCLGKFLQNNLAEANPEKVAKMTKVLDAWWKP